VKKKSKVGKRKQQSITPDESTPSSTKKKSKVVSSSELSIQNLANMETQMNQDIQKIRDQLEKKKSETLQETLDSLISQGISIDSIQEYLREKKITIKLHSP